MFVLLAYDVDKKRCNKYGKIVSKYLFRTQYSVYEGSITETKLKLLCDEIEKIRKGDDKICVYYLPSKCYLKINRFGSNDSYLII